MLIESIGDFLQTPADAALVEMVRQFKREEHFVVAEAESSSWVSSWPLFGEFKNARRGLLLQPDQTDGDVILKTLAVAREAGRLPRGPRRHRGRRQDAARAGRARPGIRPRRL